MSAFVIDYAALGFHRWMLADMSRMSAYQRAIQASIRPGDVVLDVGAGTGILGMMAARAGARKVYAIEPSAVADLARQLATANGLADRLEVIQADAEAAVLPEKVDAIVAEVWGYIGVDENLLAKLLVCRDRWLAPGGKMLPQTITSFMAPVEDAWFAEGVEFWRKRPYGFELAPLADSIVEQLRGEQHHLGADALLADPQAMWSIDARTLPVAEARRAFEAKLGFVAKRYGTVAGLAAWFRLDFPDGTTLGNGPYDPPTHWGRELLPFRRAVPVAAGTTIEATHACEPQPIGVCRQRWSARVGDGAWDIHDS